MILSRSWKCCLWVVNDVMRNDWIVMCEGVKRWQPFFENFMFIVNGPIPKNDVWGSLDSLLIFDSIKSFTKVFQNHTKTKSKKSSSKVPGSIARLYLLHSSGKKNLISIFYFLSWHYHVGCQLLIRFNSLENKLLVKYTKQAR